MPEGVIAWYDPETGEAEVARDGRRFVARRGDIESVARCAGAHVHFDILREEGAERAVNVKLRIGTRVSHHQHRFGTLVGASGYDTKGAAGARSKVHPEMRNAGAHPLEVARAWATAVARGDLPAALVLYAPGAVVHAGDRSLTGTSALQRWLEAEPRFGWGRHARIHGEGADAIISFEATEPGQLDLLLRSRIAHGEVAEQWVSESDRSERATAQGRNGAELQLQVVTHGLVPERERRDAETAVLGVLDKLREPVLLARLKLSHETDPARVRPAVAQVTIDLNGDLVRAQAAARSAPEATDLLIRRLHDRLEHRARHREFLHRNELVGEPGEWRHGDIATSRPPVFERPVEDRQLVRHKTFAVGELTPDEAVYDMEQLDYDFYLFSELASGADAVVARTESGGYRLVRASGSDTDSGPTAVPLEVSPQAPPTLSLDAAIERLNTGGESHVFFVNAGSGRGNAVYRRYDGHYGLISPE